MIELVGTHPTRSGGLVEVGIRRARVGPRRRRPGFQVVERDAGTGERRPRLREEAATYEEALLHASARLLQYGGQSGSAAGWVCEALRPSEARELFGAGLDRYLHVGTPRGGGS